MAEPLGALSFLGQAGHWRILADLLLVSMFGGLYIVPLYAIVQQRAEADYKARTIAANNVLNALFMVLGAAGAALLFAIGMTVTGIFLVIAAANVIRSEEHTSELQSLMPSSYAVFCLTKKRP